MALFIDCISKLWLFATRIFKGVSQIMLQENAITGILFLAGIFYGSVVMGAAAALATASGIITAVLLRYDKAAIDKGLYGFSAALVGVGVVLFLKPLMATWMIIIAASALATIIQHFFIRRQIPVFTLPFVVITWIIIMAANHFFPHLLAEHSSAVTDIDGYLSIAFKGFGQVIFQGSLVAGVLFFIAVAVSSPLAALYGLAASVMAGFISLSFSAPAEMVVDGLFGYNAVLCAITFAGRKKMDSLWVLLSVVLALVIGYCMWKFDLIQLTFPFVLASFITMKVKNYTAL